MLVLLLIAILMLLTAIAFIVIASFRDWQKVFIGIGAFCFYVGICFIAVYCVNAFKQNADQRASIQAILAERNSIIYQLERGAYNGSPGKFSADVIRNKNCIINK